MCTLYKTSNSLYTVFLISTVFLCSEFKLENINSGVNFWRKMFAVIFLFTGTYFCGSLEKSQKLEPAKISCHTVRWDL